jgi:hypothetical protein
MRRKPFSEKYDALVTNPRAPGSGGYMLMAPAFAAAKRKAAMFSE